MTEQSEDLQNTYLQEEFDVVLKNFLEDPIVRKSFLEASAEDKGQLSSVNNYFEYLGLPIANENEERIFQRLSSPSN